MGSCYIALRYLYLPLPTHVVAALAGTTSDLTAGQTTQELLALYHLIFTGDSSFSIMLCNITVIAFDFTFQFMHTN